jgi:hypothetical protein
MKDLPISNEELINSIKVRLERNKVVNVNECPVYQEYLDECAILIKSYIKVMDVSHSYAVDSLRGIAKSCSKIEVPAGKKVKRIPIFNQIMSDMRFLIADKEYKRIDTALVKKGSTQTINSLVHQAKGYCREAFDWSTFEDAATKFEDAADVLELAQDIYKNDMVSASKHCDFDTCVREDISDKAWSWIQTHVEGNNL